MQMQDLYKLRNIRATQAVIKDRIDALNKYGEANDGQKAALSGALTVLLWQEYEEEQRLRAFIESVSDPEIQQIMRMRFLDDMPWIEISVEITPLEKDATRNAPLMKVRRYLKNH